MNPRHLAHHWRSLLYVPGNNERFLSKAQTRGADALILDLEDSVPVNRKENAREMVAGWLGRLSTGPSALTVRINSELRTIVRDLEAIVQPGLQAVLIAKCETPERATAISEILTELEAERGLPLGQIATIALIETPGGLLHAREIAASDPRLTGLVLGSEDLAAESGMEPDTQTLAFAKQQIVFAARSAQLAPLGLMDTIANYASDGAEELVRKSKRFGFSGATCVHPGLVEALNAGFTPSEAEVADAERLIAAMDAATTEGRGAASLNGRMIDAPLLKRAENTLRKAAALTPRPIR